MINWLASNGGWGTGTFRVDFSMVVLEADSSTPTKPIAPLSGYYLPDCDQGLNFPLPGGGAIEGSPGYSCSGGDCQLIVFNHSTGILYEAYTANVTSTGIQSLCAVKWDLGKTYPATLRGDQCTSVDAAGLPVAPLLFSADELAAGSINHAIRFILPNERMRAGVFVRPATHAGGPTGPANAIPYGARLRLRANYPISSLSPGAQVVARALQQYGMILADGGNIALTARDDRYTSHKWADMGFDSYSLSALQVSDFEVVDTGATMPLTFDCVRNGN